MLPIALPQGAVDELMAEAKGANHVFVVDLAKQIVSAPSGKTFNFDIDPGRKRKLLEGLDDIGLSLKREEDIARFEDLRRIGAAWRR